MRRSLVLLPAFALLFGSFASTSSAQDVSVKIGRGGLRVTLGDDDRRDDHRHREPRRPAPPVYVPAPQPPVCEPAPQPPVCEPTPPPPACEPVRPVSNRGPREWRQPSQPVAPREWREPLCDEEYRKVMQAMSWKPQGVVQQMNRVRWLAGKNTFTVDQVIGIVGTICESADRREALLALHGSVCDKAGFSRTYALLAQCDADQLHVQLNPPYEGRGLDGRTAHHAGRRTHWRGR